MYKKIKSIDDIIEGKQIRELRTDGEFDYYILGKFMDRVGGFEVTVSGLNTGVKSGKILFRTIENLINKSCEIEI